jgi:hypothetical protein
VAEAELRLAATDTTIAGYALLAADTTAARVVRAEARDTMHFLITLDDHVDPFEELDGVRAELRALPDSTLVPGEARVIHRYIYDREEAARREAAEAAAAAKAAEAATAAKAAETAARANAAADSAAGAIADSVMVARVDSAVVARGDLASVSRPASPGDRGRVSAAVAAGDSETALPGDSAAAPADTVAPLPTRELVVIAAAPLVPKARYLVTLFGVRNINGIEDGGGTVTFEVPAAAPVDSAGAAQPDTTGTIRPEGEVGPHPESTTGGSGGSGVLLRYLAPDGTRRR